MYRLGWMGSSMPEVDFVQCLVFSAVIVAVDPVAVRDVDFAHVSLKFL